MTMKFKKFESIDNMSRLKTVNYIIEHGFSEGIWVASEKCDGANFSMWTDGTEFRVGKRNSMLHDNELDGFFSCRSVVEKYEGNVRSLFSELRLKYDCKDIRIYGELYGGHYPGVDNAPGASRIQSDKVFYCPHNDFIGFDLVMDDKYIDFLDAVEVLEAFHIPTVPILGIGSFEEMMLVSNQSVSQIPLMHMMPEIPQERFSGFKNLPELNNIIEGVVLRPNVPASFGSGSRVILKNKNIRFTESNTEKVPKTVTPMTQEQSDVYQMMFNLVTENRVRNAISKFGTITQKDFGKLLGMVNKDVIEEHLGDELENGLDSLEKKDRKMITKMINGDIANILRPHFQNICDGNW